MADEDSLATALERVADTIDAVADDERRAAREARSAARRRRQGRIEEPRASESIRTVLDLVGRSAQRLASASSGLRRVWAAELAEQGLSIRQIGEQLGVTHQRVSALLTRHRQPTARQGSR